MQRLIHILVFVYSCITAFQTQLLYQCNFDNLVGTQNCFYPDGLFGMLITEKIGSAGSQPPTAPLSDVTSSLKPTSNGELCVIPYKVGTPTWDMYFCNNGYCPTPSNPNTGCTTGKFGHFNFIGTATHTFRLNTTSGLVNGVGQRCLTYYYYLPNIAGTRQNIKVRKQETGGDSETIDTVTNSSFNGWIKRQVNFHTTTPGYTIYFDLQRTSGSSGSLIAIDEIIIDQGSCSGEPVTQTTTTTTTISTSTTTEAEILTSMPETSTVQTTTIVAPSTMISSLASTTIGTTTTSSTTTTTSISGITTSTRIMTSSITAIPSTTVITTAATFSTTTSILITEMTTTVTSISVASVPTAITTSKPPGVTTIDIPITTSGSPDNGVPSNKTLIIALSIAIPAGLIVIVGIGVWIKKTVAGGILNGISRPFSDIAHNGEETALELDQINQEHSF